MAGELDTEKLVRPVRRETHRNLVWQQIKARCVYPIVGKAENFRRYVWDCSASPMVCQLIWLLSTLGVFCLLALLCIGAR